MNRKQIQLEVCKAMLDAKGTMRIGDLGNGFVAVTVNGFIAYAFADNECIFDKTKIAHIAPNIFQPLFEREERDEKLTKTPFLVSFGNRIAIKYCCEKFDCYIDEKYYKQLAGLTLYASRSTGRVLAVDEFDCPVAVVMPIKVDEHEL